MLIEINILPIEIQQQISMSYDFPEDVADIDLELPKRQMPSQKSIELFD